MAKYRSFPDCLLEPLHRALIRIRFLVNLRTFKIELSDSFQVVILVLPIVYDISIRHVYMALIHAGTGRNQVYHFNVKENPDCICQGYDIIKTI